jgi:hypothetical protein
MARKIKIVIEDNIRYEVHINNKEKCWYLDTKVHRIGGPAVEFSNGGGWWCLYNKLYHYEDYLKEIYKIYGAGQVVLLRAKYG